MTSTDIFQVAKGTVRFLMAAKGIYDNYNKLAKSFEKMKQGGLGVFSCLNMRGEIEKLNAQIAESHHNGVYSYGLKRFITLDELRDGPHIHHKPKFSYDDEFSHLIEDDNRRFDYHYDEFNASVPPYATFYDI